MTHRPQIPEPASHRSLSGTYVGTMTLPEAGSLELELRVDIDPVRTHSPVLQRISGDFFRLPTLPQAGLHWRVFTHSWIVDPQVVFDARGASVDGTISRWNGTPGATLLSLRLEYARDGQPCIARVRFESNEGPSEFVCQRRSLHLRELSLDVAVAKSVSADSLVLPSYSAHALDERPSELPRRELDLQTCLADAGVGLELQGAPEVIDDSARGEDQRWTDAELHAAMHQGSARPHEAGPSWRLWALLCGSHIDRGNLGIMFDHRKNPERQGFAIFRNHEKFRSLPAGDPPNPEEARALRYFLHTWVHELGHGLNLTHSFEKGRPNARSWMNYPWRVRRYWWKFDFRFDREELLHLRHGNRPAVIPGSEPFGRGWHSHAPVSEHLLEGHAPLELELRSRGLFEWMEPICVELRLRNLCESLALPVETQLDPRYGNTKIQIQRPDGSYVEYKPLVCALAEPKFTQLASASSEPGSERHSVELSLTFGRDGHMFSTPGEYRIRALYQDATVGLIPSAVHRLRVAWPRGRDDERFAQDFFSDEAGQCLYFDGSRAPHLRRGHDTLMEATERYRGTLLSAQVASTLARGLARPFYGLNPETRALERTQSAASQEAMQLNATALDVVSQASPKRALNLSYHELVRQHVALLRELGDTDAAEQWAGRLLRELRQRAVKPPILREIDASLRSLSLARSPKPT